MDSERDNLKKKKVPVDNDVEARVLRGFYQWCDRVNF
jgi:hypothetical protein